MPHAYPPRRDHLKYWQVRTSYNLLMDHAEERTSSSCMVAIRFMHPVDRSCLVSAVLDDVYRRY